MRIATFFKKYIKVLVPFTMLCAVACLVGQFIYPDSPQFCQMFLGCLGVLGGELLIYALKSVTENKEEAKIKLLMELYKLKGEET